MCNLKDKGKDETCYKKSCLFEQPFAWKFMGQSWIYKEMYVLT